MMFKVTLILQLFFLVFSKIFSSFLSGQVFVMVSLLTKNLPVDG